MRTRSGIVGLCVGAMPILAPAAVIYEARSISPGGIFLIHEQDETDSGIEVAGPPGSREFDRRVGDAVTFAGTERFVTSFTTRLRSFATPETPITTDVELTLYRSDSGLPGTIIWSGTLVGLTFGGTLPVDATFMPNITVPDSICFAVAFSNISAQRGFGSTAAGATLVGSSPNGVLLQDSATLQWRQELFAPDPVFRHVEALVVAVPAPGAAGLVGMAALALLRRRR